MNDRPSTGASWNRILGRWDEDQHRSDYRAATAALAALAARYAALGRPLRHDHARDWEPAQVLLELQRLSTAAAAAQRPIVSALDLGGGNSPLAYLLAERGYQVIVVDPDRTVVEAIRKNSRELHWGERLTAVAPEEGRLPFFDATFDCVLCISVIEGILRRDRPRFWAEIRRVLRPGRSLLLTFDFGPDARLLGDPPADLAAITADLVAPSGLQLCGEPHAAPVYDPETGPPVQTTVPTVDGLGRCRIAYTFGTIHLQRPE